MLTFITGKTFFSSQVILLLLTGILFTSACKSEKSQPESEDNQVSQEQTGTQFTAQDLRTAALQGQINEVGQMIDQGIDVNALDEGGRTALMLASFNGHTEVAQLLIDEGARVEDRNAEGRTPLIFAASGPFPETVELLLKQGADPNVIDEVDGWSALMFAAAEGNKKVVQVLLDHGADPSLTDKDGETALNFAQNNDHADVAELLKSSS